MLQLEILVELGVLTIIHKNRAGEKGARERGGLGAVVDTHREVLGSVGSF